MASSDRALGAVPIRLAQGVRALTGDDDLPMPERLATSLPRQIVRRWDALPAFDRAHLMAVAGHLESSGGDRDLVLAGLLHDIGKPLRTEVVARVLVVCLPRRALPLTAALARAGVAPGIAAQVRDLVDHAAIGAEMLRDADMSRRVVSLVRHHHEPSTDSDLAALRRADDACSAKRGSRPW